MKKILIVTAILSLTFACSKKEEKADTGKPQAKTELMERANTLFIPITTIKPENISSDKIELGKKLYFDDRLSKNNTISCNSCHNLSTYGVDNAHLSLGDTQELGSRNSPSSFYAFLHFKQFWDGRAENVEEQAKGPLLNPVEHGIPSDKYLVDKLRAIPEYQEMFKKAFPEEAEPVTFDNIAIAIGAFERQLAPVSRFDTYLDGDDNALTEQEKAGLKDFMDAKCTICHNGVAIGGGLFQKFGVYGAYYEETNSKKVDNGVFDLTKDEKDKFLFKVPSLRNVEKTHPYFHDGSVAGLKDAIRIMAKLQQDIQLTDKQVDDIEAFLKSMTADIDPKYKQP
ncbi:MAG: cytochrome-c peroxidase [Flavobacteriaceae bacterium]|jgi:cytochrome c peroxidase|nr:cytochrome-c peroxidase [Flavobacteriaceae bacterium]